MARKPPSRPDTHQAQPPGSAQTAKSERQQIIDAFMGLLAAKSFEEIGLAEIARAASVSLSQLRGEFSSPLAILAAQVKATDRAVLAAATADADMAEEPPREKVFDVLM